MTTYNVIGSAAEKALIQDYELILNDASTELSDAEFIHLTDIAHIGYEYAAQKEDYIESLRDTVYEWVTEARREKLHFTQSSTEIDFGNLYNETGEVKNQMKASQSFSVIPTFFVCFGAIVLALFCISATFFATGIFQKSFPINPVYLFMFTVGLLGLLLTDVAAIVEWRKGQNEKK